MLVRMLGGERSRLRHDYRAEDQEDEKNPGNAASEHSLSLLHGLRGVTIVFRFTIASGATMKAMLSSELELIERLRARVGQTRGGGVVMGIGDDCAIVRPRGGFEDWLYTTDMLIEGTHFLRATHTAADTGWKAIARGLSDIAAMGGTPRFCLLSLALGDGVDARWVDGFYRGLLALADSAGAALLGGDIARTGHVVCDIVVAGTVPRGTALRRDGARAGDHIYVSGALGGSALGLATQRGAAWTRHKRPQPRLALGRFLREKLAATSAMDLSDGLSLDLRRLCLASNVSAEITAPPLFRGATLQQALHGGEDYELLFTMRARTEMPRMFEGLRLTRIGKIGKGRAGQIEMDGKALRAGGFDHLRKTKSKA
jgi:thiamine-monophosphate kinase